MKSKNNQPDQFWKLPFGKPLSFSILECTVLENHHQVLQPKMLQEIVLQPYIKKPDTIMSHITLEIIFSKKNYTYVRCSCNPIEDPDWTTEIVII